MNYTHLVQVSSRAFYEDIFCAKSYFGMFTYKPMFTNTEYLSTLSNNGKFFPNF